MSNNDPMAILKLSVRHMEHSMLMALNRYELDLNLAVEKAVAEYCAEDNLCAVVDSLVKREIDIAVRETVEHYFRLGEGRSAIIETVRSKLTDGSA